MATSLTLVKPQVQLEDPLVYLSTSSILDYQKGQVIYNQDHPSTNICLVIDGKVKVCRIAADGRPVIVDIYQHKDFFGESALFNSPRRDEQAVALENTTVMAWTMAEIEEIVMRSPRLGVALLQMLARRSIEFGCRIESFSVDSVAQRLGRGLIRFSERLGQSADDGSVQIMPFTHELLSQYVGTSREVVTHFMNQFRRQGYLSYSRKGIFLRPDALKSWFEQQTA
jgi:CRP/FNR family cyclic AMP-dependent transcriptional regulator